jgi:hypothetical protein
MEKVSSSLAASSSSLSIGSAIESSSRHSAESVTRFYHHCLTTTLRWGMNHAWTRRVIVFDLSSTDYRVVEERMTFLRHTTRNSLSSQGPSSSFCILFNEAGTFPPYLLYNPPDDLKSMTTTA